MAIKTLLIISVLITGNGFKTYKEPIVEPIDFGGTTILKEYKDPLEVAKQLPKAKDNRFEALVIATWRLETGNSTSWLWNNYYNPGGIKCGNDYCRYSSKKEGMQRLRILLQRYVKRYGYDLEAIRSVYSESDDTDIFRQIYNEELERLSK